MESNQFFVLWMMQLAQTFCIINVPIALVVRPELEFSEAADIFEELA
jgi:hypothetical protein